MNRPSHLPTRDAALSPPLRIGLWNIYQTGAPAAVPSIESLSNLIRELLPCEDCRELVVLTVPAGRQLIRKACRGLGSHRDRLHFVEDSAATARDGQVQPLLRSWVSRSEFVHGLLSQFRTIESRVKKGCKDSLKEMLRPWVARARRKNYAALVILALACPVIFAALWLAYTLYQTAGAVMNVLGFPFRWIDRIVRRIVRPSDDPDAARLLSAAIRADCDLWIFPALGCSQPPTRDFPSILMLDELIPEAANLLVGVDNADWLKQRASSHATDATLCVFHDKGARPFDTGETLSDLSKLLETLAIPRAKLRGVQMHWDGSSSDSAPLCPSAAHHAAASPWSAVLKEARERWPVQPLLDLNLIESWPHELHFPELRRKRVFIFLQQLYLGGVWQSAKILLSDLIVLNQHQRKFDLTLGIHATQTDLGMVEEWASSGELKLVRLRVNPVGRSEASMLLHDDPHRLKGRKESAFCFFSGAASAALEADVWLALTDRFPLPLLPARPYAVLVHDVIQRRQPDCFHPIFFSMMAHGMTPSLRYADRVLVTSPQTHDDVIASFGVDQKNIRLVPVACNPGLRFGKLARSSRLILDRPFLLNVTNATPHKGAHVMLRAYAELKRSLGASCPQLVLCGNMTEQFSGDHPIPSNPHWRAVRELIGELGLQEKHDVFFLGFVSNAELLDLYERCAVVINASLYDNGSFNLTEAAYFGRPAVSSDYSAARYLCERFRVGAHFFPPGDAGGLARAVQEALQEGPHDGRTIEGARRRYEDPEFTSLRFAERVWTVLSELAADGGVRAAA